MKKLYRVSVYVLGEEKISCIKFIRAAYSCGLKEAKELVEAFQNGPMLMTAEELADFVSFVITDELANRVGAQHTWCYDKEQDMRPLFRLSDVTVADPLPVLFSSYIKKPIEA